MSAVAGIGSVMRPQRIGNLWADTTKSGLWILFTGDAVPLSGLARCLGKYYSEPSWTHLCKLFVAFEWSSQTQILEFLIFLYFCLTYLFENVHRGFTAGNIIVVAVFSRIKGTLLSYQQAFTYEIFPLGYQWEKDWLFHSGLFINKCSFSTDCLLENTDDHRDEQRVPKNAVYCW